MVVVFDLVDLVLIHDELFELLLKIFKLRVLGVEPLQ